MLDKLFYVYNHQGKADSFIRALTSAGWEETTRPGEARFVLSDMDLLPRARSLETYAKRGRKIFLYNHAARPNLFWDFPGQHYTNFITAHILPSKGHLEILRLIGCKYRALISGWHLSDIRPFRPRKEARKILFAPIHPNRNGFLSKIDRDLNAQSFEILRSLPDISLTVRYIDDLAASGVWKAGGVEYIQGQKDGSIDDIERADLVISHQTFAFLSVALGVPTLMMAEDTAPRWGGTEAKLAFVKKWDVYGKRLAYPLDLLRSENVSSLIERAICTDEDIRDWRERMIGEPFDPAGFVEKIEAHL